MFNSEVKNKHLEIVNKTSIVKIISLFQKLEKLEDAMQKDFAAMNREEIISCIESFDYLSYATLRSDLVLLKNYVIWYNDNIEKVDIEIVENLLAKDFDLTNSIKKNLIKDENELRASLSFRKASEGYYEIPILCLSWLGLTPEVIVNLKNEDVYAKNGDVFVKTPNKTIMVKSEFIKTVLMEYSRVKTASRETKLSSSYRYVFSDDMGYFIKYMYPPGSKFIGSRVSTKDISKKITQYNNIFVPDKFKKVNISEVLKAGRLYRIYEEEQKTGCLTPDIFINEFNNNAQTYLNDVIRLYQCYKKAFER